MVSFADHVADKGSNYFGEGDDGEADEGVGNHLFGLLEFIGIARGGNVGDATVDDENGGDEAGNGDNPLEGVEEDLVSVDSFEIRGLHGVVAD